MKQAGKLSASLRTERIPAPSNPPSHSHNSDAPNFAPKSQSFSHRLDRHGRPFGERISLQSNTARPLRNNITPTPVGEYPNRDIRNRGLQRQYREPKHRYARENRTGEEYQERRIPTSQVSPPVQASPRGQHEAIEEPNERRRSQRDMEKSISPEHHISPPNTTNSGTRHARALDQRASPQHSVFAPIGISQQEHIPLSPAAVNSPNMELFPPRPPLERNLNVSDFTPPTRAVTTEEVMEQLRETTYQYVNHPDPK